MKKEFIAVLAGNFRQFNEFIRQPEVGEHCEYVYIDRPEKAYGYRFFDYKIIGKFRNIKYKLSEKLAGDKITRSEKRNSIER